MKVPTFLWRLYKPLALSISLAGLEAVVKKWGRVLAVVLIMNYGRVIGMSSSAFHAFLAILVVLVITMNIF